VLVFHEITNGPFRLQDTILAPWAPNEADENSVTMYIAELHKFIQKSHNE